MGQQMIRSFSWIDYVATSEADLSFPKLIENLLVRNDLNAPPGILGRDEGPNNAELVSDMDAIPIPDYSEFFARARSSTLGSALNPVALIETSRGCWWGAKHHCTFCGLNGATMAFRSKSIERCVREFTAVSEQHQVKRIDCVDNILDTRYIKSLFPLLAAENLDLSLFYEVKANLGYDQLQLMRAGGVRGIQPGIESFSDQVLRIMRKGCTAFQNIQLLRWCRELEIDVVWNILAGFPGESPQEYDRQADLVPLLTHLTPPTCCTPVRLDRFSPFYSSPGEFGFGRVRPAAAYYYVFPLERRELARLAYFFDFDYLDQRDPECYMKRLREEVGKWWGVQLKADGKKPRLDAKPHPRGVLIEDTRETAVKEQDVLSGISAQLYLSCDTARNVRSLARSLSHAIDDAEVRAILDGFVAAKTMVRVDDHYLSLAVFRERSQFMEVSRFSESTNVRQAATSEPLLRVV
jgi:ribosomal peptide maturation radical SAM protein 1